MQQLTSPSFGFKITGPHVINFYHILLKEIPLETLKTAFREIQHAESMPDGTIRIFVQPEKNEEDIAKNIVTFFVQKEKDFLDTPKAYYKIPGDSRQFIKSWALAFEGSLAMLLLSSIGRSMLYGSWEYINSYSGGLYLSPYTLLLYTDYPKVAHPVLSRNYHSRKMVEETASTLIRKMFKRMSEAQKGLEGVGLLSMVEEKTSIPAKTITKIINEKSFGIKPPIHSNFFSPID